MSDDLTKRKQDANLISLTEPYEVRDWTNSLKCSENLLRVLVSKLGNSATKVKEVLAQLRSQFPSVDDDSLATTIENCGIDFPRIAVRLNKSKRKAPSFGMGM